MSYSISTLLIRNLRDVFGENDPARRRAAIDEIFTEDAVFYEPRGIHRGATRSIASQARSRLLTLTFDISQLPGPRNWAMAGGSNRCLAAPVRRQLTPGLISSLPGTAGLPPFISFSTSYGELDSAVRRPMLRIGKRRRNISRSLMLLCLKQNIGNLSAIQEKSGYLLRQRGNERFVGKPHLGITSRLPVTRAARPTAGGEMNIGAD